jgi:hypothetical protein
MTQDEMVIVCLNGLWNLGVQNKNTNYLTIAIPSQDLNKMVLSNCKANEDGCILGCSTVLSGRSLLMFQRSLLPPSSGWWVSRACGISLRYRNQSSKAETLTGPVGNRIGRGLGSQWERGGNATAWSGGEKDMQAREVRGNGPYKGPSGYGEWVTGHKGAWWGLLPDYTVLQPRKKPSSYSPPWEPQILQSISSHLAISWNFYLHCLMKAAVKFNLYIYK